MNSLEKLKKILYIVATLFVITPQEAFSVESELHDTKSAPTSKMRSFFTSFFKHKPELQRQYDTFCPSINEVGRIVVTYLVAKDILNVSQNQMQEIRERFTAIIVPHREILNKITGSNRESVIALFLLNEWLQLTTFSQREQSCFAQSITQIANGKWYGISRNIANEEERSVILAAGAVAGEQYLLDSTSSTSPLHRLLADCNVATEQSPNQQVEKENLHRAAFATAMLYPIANGNIYKATAIFRDHPNIASKQLQLFVADIFCEMERRYKAFSSPYLLTHFTLKPKSQGRKRTTSTSTLFLNVQILKEIEEAPEITMMPEERQKLRKFMRDVDERGVDEVLKKCPDEEQMTLRRLAKAKLKQLEQRQKELKIEIKLIKQIIGNERIIQKEMRISRKIRVLKGVLGIETMTRLSEAPTIIVPDSEASIPPRALKIDSSARRVPQLILTKSQIDQALGNLRNTPAQSSSSLSPEPLAEFQIVYSKIFKKK